MLCNRKKKVSVFLMLLLQFIGCITAFASNDPIRTAPLLGSKDSVKVNYLSTVTDYQYLLRIANPGLLPAIEPNTTHITNTVSVGIEEENKNYIQSDFTVTIVLHIKKYDQSFETVTDEFDSTFIINYKKAEGEKYNSLQYLSFENAYKVEVKIVSITPDVTSWDVSKVLRVDNILEVSRDYVFNCTAVVEDLQVNLDEVNGELTASWSDTDNGQTEFDLEWAWIDESALAAYQYNGQFTEEKLFSNNASRVTIDGSKNHYNIPLLYDGQGRIFVRVRPDQLKTTGQRVEGDWTWLNHQSNLPVFYPFYGHQENLNWQATTTYAEDGKRKSVIQYFDGTLRSRQTVTKDNTTGTTVVAESFYDYQGRPVIQVLPAPTLNTIIQYSKNFNKSIEYDGYPKWAYDKADEIAGNCDDPAKPLSTSTGTAKYYSPNNELNSTTTDYNSNKYIPNSEGPVTGQAYPFTETRFNIDGRIASQSGVGYTHQTGSGHETKYFYESPGQDELDALFGTDAGLASHYFKNIVKDANGQYSVSYTDMHGRTVATALAGDVPKNSNGNNMLEPLTSLNTKSITKQLLDDETNRITGNSIISTKSLIVTKTGSYVFDYELKPEQLKLMACNQQEICFDCIYNLKIIINSDCSGVEGFPYTVADSNFTIGGLLTSPVCNANGQTTGYFQKQFTITLPEGAYTVTKILMLSDSARSIYREVFLGKDTCRKLEDFYNETFQVLLSKTNCEITCEECDAAIGHNLEGFRQNFIIQTGIEEPLSDSIEAAITAAYNNARANCDRICNNIDDDGMENIRSIRKIMLLDVSPAGGQYANPKNSSELYNIFNSTYANIVYTQEYKNELGQPDKFDYDGNPTPLLFSAQFKSSWAELLLPLHPEYCRLQTIEQQLPATYQFEADLKKLETWNEMVSATTPNGAYITNLVDHDPFFSNISGNAPGSAYRDLMLQVLAVYTHTDQGDFTLWQIAQSIVLCRNEDNSTADINSAKSQCVINTPPTPPVNLSACEEDRDQVWATFRSIYLTLRAKYISQYLISQCALVTNASLFAEGKTPRFFDADDNSSMSGTGAGELAIFFDQISNGDNAATQTGHDLLKQQYENTCTGYANIWIQQLSQCDILSVRWQDQGLKTTDSTWLVARLKDVCVNGSDVDHYLGASSINPDNLNVTQFGYSDFPSVVEAFYQSIGVTPPGTVACNPYQITIPGPYNKQAPLTNTAIVTKPTDCECNQITTLSGEYQGSGYSGTFSSYLEYRYHTTISQGALDTLLNLCNGTYQCIFLPEPIILPAVFQCSIDGESYIDAGCIHCGEYQAIKDSFKVLYNHNAPIANPQTEDDANWNSAFENFANYKTGFNQTWDEYLAFEDSCSQYQQPSPGSENCDSLQNIISSFTFSAKPGRITHTLRTQEEHGLTDLTKLEVNGSLQFPDSVRLLPDTWYNNYSLNIAGKLCADSGYSLEIKFKFLKNTKTGDVFYSGLGIGFTAQRYYSGTAAGLSLLANGTRYIVDTDPNALLNWMTFKAVILPGMTYMYYNGNLAFQVPRDHSVPIPDISGFGMGIFGRQGSIDWVKINDTKGNVRFFEDFNDPYHPSALAPDYMCPKPNCDSAFTAYFNQIKGTNYSSTQIDSVYNRNCGAPPDVCNYSIADTAQTCINLTNILDEYKNIYASLQKSYVDIDMRTLTGNKTPEEGPKGVFDVNNNLITNTADGTPVQVKQSFAIIWNSSAVNDSVGTLELLASGKFRLHLQPGKTMPCQGIIGMRYYQFDCPNNYINAIKTGPGSYIDFSDGTKVLVEEANSNSTTDIYEFTGGILYGNSAPEDYYVLHQFPDTSLRTITVYHSELRGTLGFDSWSGSASTLANLKNLRGYAPDEMIRAVFHSTQDSTLNTFENIVNKNNIIHLQAISFLSGDGGATPMLNFNFSPFTNNHNLLKINLNSLDTTLLNTVFPDMPGNFKKLRVIQSLGYNYTDDVKFLLPELSFLNIVNGLQSYQVDTILNQLARSVISDSGSVYLHHGNGPRTSASDGAVSILEAKGWYIFTASDTSFNPIPYLNINDSIPFETTLYSEFTDFLNARLHTNFTINELNQLYINKCGAAPTPCLPDISYQNSPILCGNTQPVFQTLKYEPAPCKDLDKIAFNASLEKWQLYTDSIRNVFDTSYYNKCMNAKYLESFKVTYEASEYHYTLYYYDQAGNLVKTVPPAGVDDKHGDANFLEQVKLKRTDALLNGASASNQLIPEHTLVTRYRYNTLNQLTTQKTPDAGVSQFWYDALGRLVVSQNAKQTTPEGTGVRFSYTEYDIFGRIVQVGQKPQTTAMTQAISRDPVALNNWLTVTQNKEQITRTVYDISYFAGEQPGTLEPTLYQKNLRNRVSYTQVFDLEPPGINPDKWAGTHTAATYYTYDIHGNVDILLQDYNTGAMADAGNRYKKIEYNYDLISGKVNRVSYQPGQPDAFYHKYEYDAENRLTDVYTSQGRIGQSPPSGNLGGFFWEHDARYYYYKHGPLARTILGQQQVQGIDYAYTLQGWLKGVNSTEVNDGKYDIGQDGKIGSMNSNVARDAYGFALSYNNTDYKPIYPQANTSVKPFATAASAGFGFKALYNGNIAGMGVNIPKAGQPLLYTYTYDQLNRLTKMFTYSGLNPATNNWNVNAIDDYREQFSYNPDGSILTLKRNGSGSNVTDNATWHYYPGTHRLEHINDPAGRHGFDAGMQAENNYSYNEVGEMTADRERGLTNISWNVYGKVSQQQLADGRIIKYTYDASGNRISKQVTGIEAYTEWYVRDATGNVLSIYKKTDSLRQTEQYKYGSNMLGLKHHTVNMEDPPLVGNIITFTAGEDEYYLGDHRGNNMVTVMDTRTQHDYNGDGIIDYYTANVATAQDYSSFGALLEGRQYGTTPRFTYNGKELDKETGWQNYGMREYLGGEVPVFASVDPITKKYPELTPYQFASNTPIQAIDIDGLEKAITTFYFTSRKNAKVKLVDASLVVDNTKPRSETIIINLDHRSYLANSYNTLEGRDDELNNNGDFSGIRHLSSEDLAGISGYGDFVFDVFYQGKVKEQAVIHESNAGPLKYPTALLDFKNRLYELFNFNPDELINIDGVAYNANEAGNYLWGMVLQEQGIFLNPKTIAELGTSGRQDESYEKRAIQAGINKANYFLKKGMPKESRERAFQYYSDDYYNFLNEGGDKSQFKPSDNLGLFKEYYENEEK